MVVHVCVARRYTVVLRGAIQSSYLIVPWIAGAVRVVQVQVIGLLSVGS